MRHMRAHHPQSIADDPNVDEPYYHRVRILPGPLSLSISPPHCSPPKPTQLFKVAVIGDALVGKSTIVNKFIYRRYATHTNPTNNDTNVDTDTIGESGLKFGHEVQVPNVINNDCGGNGGAASYHTNSIGTSSLLSGGRHYYGGKHERGGQPTLAEYYKKDICIWPDHSADKLSLGCPEPLERMDPICIRVQCWDVNIPPPAAQTSTSELNAESNSYHAQSFNSDNSTLTTIDYYNSSNIAESLVQQLLKRVNCVLIVCRCPHPPSNTKSNDFISPSNASYVSNASDISSFGIAGAAVGWPELDALQKEIESYTTTILFKENEQKQKCTSHPNYDKRIGDEKKMRILPTTTTTTTTPTIFVLLSCADLVVGEYSPRQYVQLTNRMDEICHQCNIVSWKMGTCIDTRYHRPPSIGWNSSSSTTTMEEGNTTSTDWQDNNNNNNTILPKATKSRTWLQHLIKQQLYLMEEMEDAIEGIFIEMISHTNLEYEEKTMINEEKKNKNEGK